MYLAYPLLFGASFFGTKFIGLERTIQSFEKLGVFQRKHFRNKNAPRQTLEKLEKKITTSYSLVPLPIQCLEQAVVTWYILNLNGYSARIKIGLSLTPLRSHAWVEVGEQVFGDISGLKDLKIVAEYPGWLTGGSEAS